MKTIKDLRLSVKEKLEKEGLLLTNKDVETVVKSMIDSILELTTIEEGLKITNFGIFKYTHKVGVGPGEHKTKYDHYKLNLKVSNKTRRYPETSKKTKVKKSK